MSAVVENPRGQSRVTVMLNGVTEPQLDRIVDEIADLLVAHGLGEPKSDPDADVRSMILVAGDSWPRSDRAWKRRMRREKAATIIFPAEPESF